MTETLREQAFWFLRHGETDWNAKLLSQGSVDIPLNAHGIEQAVAAAQLLPGRGITTIVASPLGRAQVTAQHASSALGLPFATDPDLRETSFGVREGEPMAEWFTEWVEERATPEGATPFADLRARAVGAVNRALDNPPFVLIVAHGAFFRALRSAMGLEPNVRLPNAIPILCSPPGPDGGPWSLVPA